MPTDQVPSGLIPGRGPGLKAHGTSPAITNRAPLKLDESLRADRALNPALRRSAIRQSDDADDRAVKGRKEAPRAEPIRLSTVHPTIGALRHSFACLAEDSDANKVQGFSGRRRPGGGHVERGDGEISLCAGLQVIIASANRCGRRGIRTQCPGRRPGPRAGLQPAVLSERLSAGRSAPPAAPLPAPPICFRGARLREEGSAAALAL